MTGRDTHPDPGSFLGPYRIVSLVGRGGASVVMEVAGPEPGRLALKLIRWTDGPDVAGRRRFLHEARAMRAVHRPHLVPLLDVGEWQGRPYLVMPLFPRGSLRDLLARDGRLSVASSVRVATDVAGAAGALHRAGIIHRDLKASSVLLTEDGDVRLADLGRAHATDWSRVTEPGQVVGTLDHLAPEVLRGEPATVASDVYALGCPADACLIGGSPFEGLPVPVLIQAIQEQDPADPALLRPDVPAPLAWAILQSLSRDPAARPGTAHAFARLLAVGARAAAG